MLTLLPSPVLAAEVIVFGDSWAEGAANELEEVLASHGRSDLDVDPRGVGGTTAEYWADVSPDTLPDAIRANPDAEWIWLSIGGNDTFANYLAGESATNAADIEANVRTMLDGAFAANPDIKVVNFGYDFVNFEQSQECILTAWTYFPVGTLTYQINTIFLVDIGETMARIAADYPNFTYVDSVWGTLQRAGGIGTAPDILYPSPSQYMSDCIHPTSEGYTLIHEALYDAYWAQDPPVASFTPDTTTVCGEPITFVDTSTGADRIRWTVDGLDAGSDPSLTPDLSASGTHTVSLRADAGAWSDTETREIEVLSAVELSVAGPNEVSAGEVAVYAATEVEGGSYVWDVQDGEVVAGAGTASIEVVWPSAGLRRLVLEFEDGCTDTQFFFADVEVTDTAGDSGNTGDGADSGAGTPVDPDKSEGTGCGCTSDGRGGPVAMGLLVGLLVLRPRRRA